MIIKLKKLTHTLIIISGISTFIWSDTLTLSPIYIQEENLTLGTVILSENEALQTASVTLQERLEQDISFSVVVGDKGEQAISFRGLDFKYTEFNKQDFYTLIGWDGNNSTSTKRIALHNVAFFPTLG